MAKKLDKILVVDIESTCWEGKTPPDMESDIIEIGIDLLDVQTGQISDSEGLLIKPERSEISDFCTKLTTITPEMIAESGISFAEGLQILKEKYNAKKRAWASFGAYDLNQFRRQCQVLDMDYPFSPSHLNVKTLFALKSKLNHEVGMATALKMRQIELEGTHHRGVNDAYNIAKILRWILE